QAQVPEPDLHEAVQHVLQPGQQWRHRRLGEPAHPLGEVADLHGADVGDVEASDPGGAGPFVEPGAAAVGAGDEGDGPVHETADVGLHRLPVPGEEGLADAGDQPLVGHVDAGDVDLGRFAVQQVVQLPLVVPGDGLVRVE